MVQRHGASEIQLRGESLSAVMLFLMSHASLVILPLQLTLSPCLTPLGNPLWSPRWCSIKGEMRIVVMTHLLPSLMILLLLLFHKLFLHQQILVLVQLLHYHLLDVSIHLDLDALKGSLKGSALEKKYASQPEPSQSAFAPPASPIMSSDSEDELLLKDDNDHELDHVSVTQAGLDYILAHQHSDYLSWDEALGYALNTSEHALKTSNHDGEPETYAEAMSRPEEERKLWHKAALDEIQALIDNGTF